MKPGSCDRSICRGCILVDNVWSFISFCWMLGRKSVQGLVTRGGEVVMLSVRLYLTSVPCLVFTNLPVSGEEGVIGP